MARKPRILFILKHRLQSGGGQTVLKHSGLYNSASFVCNMLGARGYNVTLVQVVDNNDIDREVTRHAPDVVIIEALWVVPEKFHVLRKLHPHVRWVVRLHSELPFLANEGVAFDWINQYVRQPNVFVSTNSRTAQRDLEAYLDAKPSLLLASAPSALRDKLIYLPNYYPVRSSARTTRSFLRRGDLFHVGCFGAIRPMKNHLIQAAAAVRFAERHGLHCRFHVNAARTEQKGEVVLKNLRAFFHGLGSRHQLVEHGWLERDEFLALVGQMHIGLQVSFSETFNIVSADFVSEDVPIVVSSEVDWMPRFFTADPNDVKSMVAAMERTMWYDRSWTWLDWPRRELRKVVKDAERVWIHAMDAFGV